MGKDSKGGRIHAAVHSAKTAAKKGTNRNFAKIGLNAAAPTIKEILGHRKQQMGLTEATTPPAPKVLCMQFIHKRMPNCSISETRKPHHQ